MKKRILFIVNPISGGQNKTFIPSLIDQHLDHDQFNAEIIFSNHVGHAKELTVDALTLNFEVVASVGGDGTINEVASVMESSGKMMAIIPCGSGNGLARTLNIPLNNGSAISRLNQLRTTKIDVGSLNGRKFFNIAGMGFDAHISAHFSMDKKRGFGGYVKSTLKEIRDYQPEQYSIEVDGQVYEREAFMISVANSSQYGNNAYVSPLASVKDGLLDVCIIKPFPLYSFPALGYRMFTKTAHHSKYVEIIKGRAISIKRIHAGPIHVDGEPVVMGKNLTIEIKHLALELII